MLLWHRHQHLDTVGCVEIIGQQRGALLDGQVELLVGNRQRAHGVIHGEEVLQLLTRIHRLFGQHPHWRQVTKLTRCRHLRWIERGVGHQPIHQLLIELLEACLPEKTVARRADRQRAALGLRAAPHHGVVVEKVELERRIQSDQCNWHPHVKPGLIFTFTQKTFGLEDRLGDAVAPPGPGHRQWSKCDRPAVEHQAETVEPLPVLKGLVGGIVITWVT